MRARKGKHHSVFICGHPRAASTHLYYSLRVHPELRNDVLYEKEAKFFSSVVGDRPWIAPPTLTTLPLEIRRKIDDRFVRRLLRETHAFVSKHFGGPGGRYLNGYPYDVFAADRIWDADQSSKFVVVLREPVANVWSMLNYKRTRDWIPNTKPEDSVFHEKDVWDNTLRWSQPIWALAGHYERKRLKEAMLLVKFEELVERPAEMLRVILEHLELDASDDVERAFLGDSIDPAQVHSSYYGEGDVRASKSRLVHAEERIRALEHPNLRKAVEYYLALTEAPRKALGLTYLI